MNDRHGGPLSICPECDGPMSQAAKRCRLCENASRTNSGTRRGMQDAGSLSIGRTEAIITFTRGSEVMTLHCFGDGARGQIANGVSRLPGDGWQVACRSTPRTILADLKARDLSPKAQLSRLEVIRRTERVA